MYKFFEISKDYRDLVKPERMSSIPMSVPLSKIVLKE